MTAKRGNSYSLISSDSAYICHINGYKSSAGVSAAAAARSCTSFLRFSKSQMVLSLILINEGSGVQVGPVLTDPLQAVIRSIPANKLNTNDVFVFIIFLVIKNRPPFFHRRG